MQEDCHCASPTTEDPFGPKKNAECKMTCFCCGKMSNWAMQVHIWTTTFASYEVIKQDKHPKEP